MQAHNPYTLPTLDPTEQDKRIIISIESIADTIQGAQLDTLEIITHATILNEVIDTDQLTESLNTAREALKTAYTLAEALLNKMIEYEYREAE